MQGGAPFNAAALGSVTNYRATYQVANQYVDLNLVYIVHSPTNWEELSVGGSRPLVVVVNGTAYGAVPTIAGSSVTISWQKATPVAYKTTPYPSTVASILDLPHVSGVKVAAAGPCADGSASGTAWKTEPAAPGAVAPVIAFCTATKSGALLWYALGSGSGGTYSILPPHAATKLQISDIGKVPPIAIPK